MAANKGRQGQAGEAAGSPQTARQRADERLARFEYDVFLSYSSEDRERAAAIVKRLQAAGLRVFWDRDIVSGALWRPTLTRALRTSQLTVVLWSQAAKSSVWVQAEAEQALKLGVLQQVVIDAVVPDLPFNQLQILADLSTWRPGEQHEHLELLAERLNELVGAPVQQLEKELAADSRRRLLRQRQRRIALRIAAPIALVVSFLLAAGVLDPVLSIDTRLRLISVWARGALTQHTLHERVTFIRINEESLRALEKKQFDKSWRPLLATAIENLATQGAAVIALDINFQPPERPDAEVAADTEQLARAIIDARSGHLSASVNEANHQRRRDGTAVVVAVENWNSADPPGPSIEPAVKAALAPESGWAPGYLGVSCGGLEGGFASTFPLLVDKRETTDLDALPPLATDATGQDGQKVFASLSLATALADWRTHSISWEFGAARIALSEGQRPFVLLSGFEEEASVTDCSMIGEDERVAKLIVEQAPADNPWRNVIPFEKTLRPDQLAPFAAQVENRICLVGVDVPSKDHHRVWSGGLTKVPGVKLHADAITTLLDGVALRRLPPFLQLVVMLILGGLAALSRLAVPPSRPQLRTLCVASLIALDIAAAALCAAYLGLFMDAAYHLGAILLSYVYAQRLEGRFFIRTEPRSVGGT